MLIVQSKNSEWYGCYYIIETAWLFECLNAYTCRTVGYCCTLCDIAYFIEYINVSTWLKCKEKLLTLTDDRFLDIMHHHWAN